MKTKATVFILGNLVLIVHLPSVSTSSKTLAVPRKVPSVSTSSKTLAIPKKLPWVSTSSKTLAVPKKLPWVSTSSKTLAVPKNVPWVSTSSKTLVVPKKLPSVSMSSKTLAVPKKVPWVSTSSKTLAVPKKLPLVFTSPETLPVPEKLPLVFTSPETLPIPEKLPLVFTSPKTLAVPVKLQQAVGKVIVNATACTVTCGLGYKEETVCEVGPDGVRRKCKSQRLECLTNWICGMLHFTIVHGDQFELSCLSADILEVGQESFRFTWKIARGIISTNDEVFKSFRANSYFLRFKPAYEYDSGTYRCDVQQLKNLRFVKRLYFGLRVLPPKLVNLNFHQSLTEDQKLIDEGWEVNLDNHSKPHLPKWQKKVASALGIGIAGGVVGGVLVSIAVRSVLRIDSDDSLSSL